MKLAKKGKDRTENQTEKNKKKNMMQNKDEDTRDMRIRLNNLHKLAPTTIEKIEERERLMKIKANLKRKKWHRQTKYWKNT